MIFENELIAGVLIKRYKRFFVNIKVKNKVITAHCPNTGSMMGLLKSGNKVWFTETNNSKRKLKYTLQIIELNGNKVGINTHLTNRIFHEALLSGKIINIKKTDTLFKEKKFNDNTRFDFFIKRKDRGTFIEVKNVTLSRYTGLAEFPDAVTERGLKHIRELIEAKKRGFDIYLAFVIQREDCKKFKIAHDIDLKYKKLLTVALKNKLKVICYDCKFSSKGIIINNQINFIND